MWIYENVYDLIVICDDCYYRSSKYPEQWKEVYGTSRCHSCGRLFQTIPGINIKDLIEE